MLPLVLGRARLSLARDEADGGFEGAVSVSRHSFGIDDLSGRLRLGALFAPLPIAALDLDEVSVRFAGGLCESAAGTVRATLSGDMAGIALLVGAARQRPLRAKGRCCCRSPARRRRSSSTCRFAPTEATGSNWRFGQATPPPATAPPPPASRPRAPLMCGDSTAPSDRLRNRQGEKDGLRRSCGVRRLVRGARATGASRRQALRRRRKIRRSR